MIYFFFYVKRSVTKIFPTEPSFALSSLRSGLSTGMNSKLELKVCIFAIHLHIQSFFQSALGRLCFTGDMWSSLGMHPYLAITIHWLSCRPDTGHVVLQQALLAFRCVRGAHSGARLLRIVMGILESAEIVDNVFILFLSIGKSTHSSTATGRPLHHG